MITQQNPTMTLNNGIRMPALGFGVFLNPPEQTAQAVRTALHAGYRMVDTASAYLNERAVGEGIRTSGIDREQVFVTTKIFPSEYGHDTAQKAFDGSLERLGLDYLDLYLLHRPTSTRRSPPTGRRRSCWPTGACGPSG